MPDTGIRPASAAKTLAAINLNLRLLFAIARAGVQFLLHEIRDPMRSIVSCDVSVDSLAGALDDPDVPELRNVGRLGHDRKADLPEERAMVFRRDRGPGAVSA